MSGVNGAELGREKLVAEIKEVIGDNYPELVEALSYFPDIAEDVIYAQRILNKSWNDGRKSIRYTRKRNNGPDEAYPHIRREYSNETVYIGQSISDFWVRLKDFLEQKQGGWVFINNQKLFPNDETIGKIVEIFTVDVEDRLKKTGQQESEFHRSLYGLEKKLLEVMGFTKGEVVALGKYLKQRELEVGRDKEIQRRIDELQRQIDKLKKELGNQEETPYTSTALLGLEDFYNNQQS